MLQPQPLLFCIHLSPCKPLILPVETLVRLRCKVGDRTDAGFQRQNLPATPNPRAVWRVACTKLRALRGCVATEHHSKDAARPPSAIVPKGYSCTRGAAPLLMGTRAVSGNWSEPKKQGGYWCVRPWHSPCAWTALEQVFGQAHEEQGEAEQQAKLPAVTPPAWEGSETLLCAGWEEMPLSCRSSSGMVLGVSY